MGITAAETKFMEFPRFYCDSPLTAGLCVELSLAESHHAMHVLRLRVGEGVVLCNGRGEAAAGRIVQAKHGRVRCEVGAVEAAEVRRRPGVHVGFAVPKGKRLDWLLEKATELGASSLWPVAFERSVAGGDELAEGKRERWLGHCVAAAKQSGLNFLPELRELLPLPELLSATAEAVAAGGLRRFVGDVTADAVPLATALGDAERPVGACLSGACLPGADILILIGPEGGLTDGERRLLAAAHVTPVRLGHTVLRIETAVVALLAAVMALTR